MEIDIPAMKMVPVKDLRVDNKNPNRMTPNQLAALEKGIKKFGFIVPIITNSKLVIADGEHRLKVARKLGMVTVPVIALQIEEVDRRILRQVMNKLRGTHEIDDDLEEFRYLLEEDSLGILASLLGEDENDFLTLIDDDIGHKSKEFDIDKYLKTPKYKLKLGDIWKLGTHRLMCGNATSEDDMNALIKRPINMLFTDPPYGINAVSHNKVGITGGGTISGKGLGVVKARTYKKILGDDKPFDPTHLLKYGRIQLIFGANNFASRLPDNSHWLVWDKKAEIAADQNFFSDVELIWTNINRKSCLIYRHLWSGLLRGGERKTELVSRVHPTQKPVGLLIQILKDYSKHNDVVLDPYGGSGSTLIACEESHRTCYIMELDPAYCSVIIERWEQLTGKEAQKLKG